MVKNVKKQNNDIIKIQDKILEGLVRIKFRIFFQIL